MLLKKNKVLSFVVSATLFAGCQTAQKSSSTTTSSAGPVSDAELMIPDAYFADNGEGYRGIASGPGDWFEALNKLVNKVDGGAKALDDAIAKFNLNAADNADIAALKKKHGNMTREKIKTLGADEAKVVDKLMSATALKALLKASAKSADDFEALRFSVRTSLGKVTANLEDGKGANTFRRTGRQKIVTRDANGKVVEAKDGGKFHLEETYDKAYVVRMRSEILRDPALAKAFEGADNAKVLDDFLRVGKECHMTTGIPCINKNMCIPDPDAMRMMTKMVSDKMDAAKSVGKLEDLKVNGKVMTDANGKPIKVHKLCPEAAAWVTARLEQTLGREGQAAWLAAAEVCGACGFCGPTAINDAEAAVSRKLASAGVSEVPKNMPKCE